MCCFRGGEYVTRENEEHRWVKCFASHQVDVKPGVSVTLQNKNQMHGKSDLNKLTNTLSYMISSSHGFIAAEVNEHKVRKKSLTPPMSM